MKYLLYITFTVIALVALTAPSHAASNAGDVDGSFIPGSSVTGPVYAIAMQTNGQIIVGGNMAGAVARLNLDGSGDTNFLAGVLISAYGTGHGEEIDSIILQPDGKVLIGGYFSHVNGTTRNGVARLNTNGSLDANFLNGVQGSWLFYTISETSIYSGAGQVNSIALQSGTNVFVGGYFNQFNSTTHYGIVQLKSDGAVSTNFLDHWNGGYIPSIFATALQPDGKVLIGGDFGIARLNPNGHRDTNFVTTVDQVVNSIALQPDGKVLIGGYFTLINGTNQNNIARVTTNGILDTSFVATADDRVITMAVQPNGKVLIGGLFHTVNGVARLRVARLNTDGNLDTGFLDGQAGADGAVVSFALQPDGRILMGGEFTSVNGVAAPYLARLYGTASPVFSNFGFSSNHFGFDITGESNQVVVVEGSTNLVNWMALKTNTIGAGPLPFTDNASASFSKRFYRARLQ